MKKRHLMVVGAILMLCACQPNTQNSKTQVINTSDINDPKHLFLGGIYDDGVREVTFRMEFTFDGGQAHYKQYAEWGCFKALIRGNGPYEIAGDKVLIDLSTLNSEMTIAQTVVRQEAMESSRIRLRYHGDNTVTDPVVDDRTFETIKAEFLQSTGKIPEDILLRQCLSMNKKH